MIGRPMAPGELGQRTHIVESARRSTYLRFAGYQNVSAGGKPSAWAFVSRESRGKRSTISSRGSLGAKAPAEARPSSIANETVFELGGLNRELGSLVHQKAGMMLLWSEVLGSFRQGLAPPVGTEEAVPVDPGAGERLGYES